MAKLFQIYESDLQKMETAFPRLAEMLGVQAASVEGQVLLSEIKEIISNIRWNYGPPTYAEIIKDDED